MSSSLPPQKPDVTLSLSLRPTSSGGLKPEEGDVKLIQLLLTCASHASSGNLHHADACLRQISRLASINGDSMQRLAVRFASALAVRLVKRWPGLYKSLNINGAASASCDIVRAREIFERTFPCIEFAYAVINRVLFQAMSREHVIHVIDLGSGNPKLWVAFIRGLHELSDEFDHGPPHLKITCIGKDKEAQERLRAVLVKEAEVLSMPFQFNPVMVDIRDLKMDMLKIEPGEALALISILSLHVLLAEDDRVESHFGLSKNDQIKDTKRLNEFLEMVKSMSPKVVLLVEQESNHNSNRLVDRFVEGLHYYSAIFDSIDVAFGGFSRKDRTTLEEMFGKEIENIVSCEGMEREERHERFRQWAVRFGKVGIRPIRLWSENMDEALKVVEDYGPSGFKVISEKGSLMICWHDRPIYAVSSWNCFRFLANNDG
ncbi:scarecrow-like protein 3 [Primulina tabacum]|uniref:scarecrow-like protein 3 n=1 Tax=Primulina tabacum TaxID=48773 RepID=UPI003F59FFA4